MTLAAAKPRQVQLYWRLRVADWGAAKIVNADEVFELEPSAGGQKVAAERKDTAEVEMLEASARANGIRLTLVRRLAKQTRDDVYASRRDYQTLQEEVTQRLRPPVRSSRSTLTLRAEIDEPGNSPFGGPRCRPIHQLR